MKLPDKTAALSETIAKIPDEAIVMIGGFGVPGTPFTLIHELTHHGAKSLTIIKNDANEYGMGIDHLLAAGLVRKLITTHIGLNSRAVSMMNSGEIEIEFVAQGILAERIRCTGAGLSGFVTDIGMNTEFAIGKTRVNINGQDEFFESALYADFALIHANKADSFGNLCYSASARNFNPLMAMAAKHVIVEAEEIVPLGDIEADHIHTAGPFVDEVIKLDCITEEYQIVER